MKAMVAIDDSDASLHVLKWTVDHLFDASGAGESQNVSGDGAKTLVILHVQKPLRHHLYHTDALLTAPSSDVVQAGTKALEENSARIIARAMEVCRGMLATVEAMVVDGEPKETICDVAEKIHPDLVVVGSRGLGKIKRAFLGSVSDYCADHLHCPVLIVKPTPSEDTVADEARQRLNEGLQRVNRDEGDLHTEYQNRTEKKKRKKEEDDMNGTDIYVLYGSVDE